MMRRVRTLWLVGFLLIAVPVGPAYARLTAANLLTEANLRSALEVWLKSNAEAVRTAKGLTLLTIPDLRAGQLKFSPPYGIVFDARQVNPGQITDSNRAEFKRQLEVLFKDAQMGFFAAELHQLDAKLGTSGFNAVLAVFEVQVSGDKESPKGQACASPCTSCGSRASMETCSTCGRIGGVRCRRHVAVACDCMPAPVACGCQITQASPAPAAQRPAGGSSGSENLPSRLVQPPSRSASAKPLTSISYQEILACWSPSSTKPVTALVTANETIKLASAEERQLAAQLFGEAYHAFWQDDYRKSLDQIDVALGIHAGDARLWYYKGLAELRLGSRAAATASLAEAVRLHSLNSPERKQIDAALQRVQGTLRAELQRALFAIRSANTVQPSKPAPPKAVDKVASAH